MERNEERRINIVPPLVEPSADLAQRARAELSLIYERLSELWLTLEMRAQPAEAVVRIERRRN